MSYKQAQKVGYLNAVTHLLDLLIEQCLTRPNDIDKRQYDPLVV